VDHVEVRGHDFDVGPGGCEATAVDWASVVGAMSTTGFQASHLGDAVKAVNEMLAWERGDAQHADEAHRLKFGEERGRCTIFLGYTSNLISSGVRETIRFLVQHRVVDCVVTTAGGVEEDLVKCLRPTYVGDFALDGKRLRQSGVNRIGNLLVPNENYVAFEEWIHPILDAMLEEQVRDGVKWTPSAMIDRLGREVGDESSVYYWCHKQGIPVFCPALTDGSIGDMLYFHSYRNPGLVLDIVADIRGINDLALKAEHTGMVILGGGVAKHHICNANLMRNGADHAVFINTGGEFDGSDSGARPDEAISWGKVKPDSHPVKVYGDASVLFPLLVGSTFAPHVYARRRAAAQRAGGLAGEGPRRVCAPRGIMRWDPPGTSQASNWCRPSFSFASPEEREVQLQGGDLHAEGAGLSLTWRVEERDGSAWCRAEVRVNEGTTWYGTGMVSGPTLERSGKTIECWNSDCYGYGAGTRSLYQSHPWVVAVGPSGSAVGILADTAARIRVATSPTEAVLEGPGLFPVVTFGPCEDGVSGVVKLLHRATGTAPMPPLWALGFHQCRWSYFPSSRVVEVVDGFRERGLPLDVMWMDIDYMRGFRSFTVDEHGFGDARGLSRALHQREAKGIWMLDPGIKAEPGWDVFDEGEELNAWVRSADGKAAFQGDVWPGACVFPDFTAERVRTWWAGRVARFQLETQADGVWNDMNEPAVFRGVEKTADIDSRHDADSALGGPGSHAEFHNVYGHMMVQATRQGVAKALGDAKRPFVLTRAGFMGTHRSAACWTGDNVSSWEHLGWSIPMALNLGLSGQPLCGPDIGGFAGRCTASLYARWMGIGCLLPFARCHTEKSSGDQEPWAFGDACERVSRLALRRRYALLPHLYSLFHAASTRGDPVLLPIFDAQPDDPGLRSESDAFLLGPNLLVACSSDRERPLRGGYGPDEACFPSIRASHGFAEVEVLAPMRDFCHGIAELPRLLLRGGCILCCADFPDDHVRPVRSTVDLADKDGFGFAGLHLFVNLDATGRAEGSVYEDYLDGAVQGRIATFVATSRGRREVEVFVNCESRAPKVAGVFFVLGDNVLHPSSDVVLDSEGRFVRATATLPPKADVHQMVEGKREEMRAACATPAVEDTRDREAEKALERAKAQPPVDLRGGTVKVRCRPAEGAAVDQLICATGGGGADVFSKGGGKSHGYGFVEFSTSPETTVGDPLDIVYAVTGQAVLQFDAAERLFLAADVGSGLTLRREIGMPLATPDQVRAAGWTPKQEANPHRAGEECTVAVESALEATSVGQGSGGFSRPAMLRGRLAVPLGTSDGRASCASYQDAGRGGRTQVSGRTPEALPGSVGEVCVHVPQEPGQWLRLSVSWTPELVHACVIERTADALVVELRTPERAVSAETPLLLSQRWRLEEVDSPDA